MKSVDAINLYMKSVDAIDLYMKSVDAANRLKRMKYEQL